MSRDLEESGDRTFLVHTWMNGTLWAGYEAIFVGFLLSQDLRKTRLIHWTSEDWFSSSDPIKVYIANKYQDSTRNSIEFRVLDHVDLARGTCFEHRPEFLEKTSVYAFGIRDWSNVVRWLLLHRYGGIWIDSDSLPLMNFLKMYKAVPRELVAGYVPDDWSKSKVAKEAGYFNNNFLLLADSKMRKTIMEVVCMFRREPIPDPGDSEKVTFRNQIPTIGEGDDVHELRVLNNWIYNDGVLRMCWIRQDCRLTTIGLGETDPAWMRTNDMWPMCEHISQSLERYTTGMKETLRHVAKTGNTDSLLDSKDWKEFVWVLHHRSSHCRTSGTMPMGMFSWMYNLALQRLGPDVSRAPVEPVEFLMYDHFEYRLPNNEVEFTSMILVVESETDDREGRHRLRSLMSVPSAWFKDTLDAFDHQYKLVFIVPYPSDEGIGTPCSYTSHC